MYSKDTACKTCDNVSEIGKQINRTLICLIWGNFNEEKKKLDPDNAPYVHM